MTKDGGFLTFEFLLFLRDFVGLALLPVLHFRNVIAESLLADIVDKQAGVVTDIKAAIGDGRMRTEWSFPT